MCGAGGNYLRTLFELSFPPGHMTSASRVTPPFQTTSSPIRYIMVQVVLISNHSYILSLMSCCLNISEGAGNIVSYCIDVLPLLQLFSTPTYFYLILPMSRQLRPSLDSESRKRRSMSPPIPFSKRNIAVVACVACKRKKSKVRMKSAFPKL